MSYIPEDYVGQGEYSVQTRSESFVLRGEWSDDPQARQDGLRHGIHLSADGANISQGSVEILTADIDKVRVCLDVADWISQRGERGTPFAGIVAAWEVLHSDGELLARVRTREQAEELHALIDGSVLRPLELVESATVQQVRDEHRQEQATLELQRQEALRLVILNAFTTQTSVSCEDVTGHGSGTIVAVDMEQGIFRLSGEQEPREIGALLDII